MAFCCGLGKRAIMENGLPKKSGFSSATTTLKGDLGLTKPNDPPSKDPFYGLDATNESLAKYAPGTILRKRATYLTSFPGFDADNMVGWQMAFVTTGPKGDKQNMVATIVIPPNANRSKVVVQSPKASGAQPSCRTSYFLREGSGSVTGASSEQIFMSTFLDRGYIVVLTDAQGQYDAFGSGPQAGRAVLDTIRATLSFEELKLAPRDKLRVVGWGYSAGGLATIWAASLMETYAPDVGQVMAGWSTGGVPYNMRDTAYSVNKGIGAGLLLGVMRGFSNLSPELSKWLDGHLNDDGKKQYEKTKTGCFFSFMPPNVDADVLGVNKSENKPGHYGYFTIPNALDDPIPAAAMSENSLMTQYNATKDNKLIPKTPMLVYCSIADYVVPIAGLDAIMKTWAAGGASITYRRMKAWQHVSGVFAYQSENVQWISDRLDGKPTGLKAGELSQEDVDTLIDDDSATNVLGKARTTQLKAMSIKKQNNASDPWF